MIAAGGIVQTLALGVAVWVVGLHVFDLVHWQLHSLLRARSPALRWLATPHAIHHRWLDARLAIHPELRTANFLGHICLEYATQIAFSALLAIWLPLGVVAVAAVIQTMIFGYVASQRGLDVNHRPVELLDAYRPSWLALPAYHALHHVYPDAYFSAYSKLIDHLAGSGTWLRGRRCWLVDAESPFGRELRRLLVDAGAVVTTAGSVAEVRTQLAKSADPFDVLVLCAPAQGVDETASLVDAFVLCTRDRQLPPEIWIVLGRATDAPGRVLYGDPRVTTRLIVVGDSMRESPAAGTAAARRAFARILRGCNFVSGSVGATALREFVEFRVSVAREAPASRPTRSQLASLASTKRPG